MSQTSLALFETVVDAAARPQATAAISKPPGGDPQQRHLLAARRLARRMARLPDHSPEQVHAGRMICRHLVAMLKEAAAQASTPPH